MHRGSAGRPGGLGRGSASRGGGERRGATRGCPTVLSSLPPLPSGLSRWTEWAGGSAAQCRGGRRLGSSGSAGMRGARRSRPASPWASPSRPGGVAPGRVPQWVQRLGIGALTGAAGTVEEQRSRHWCRWRASPPRGRRCRAARRGGRPPRRRRRQQGRRWEARGQSRPTELARPRPRRWRWGVLEGAASRCARDGFLVMGAAATPPRCTGP